jgi:hypothetical protein
LEFSVAAGLLALVIGLPVVRRHEADAAATIRAATEPLAGRVVPPRPPEPQHEPSLTPRAGAERVIPANQLAQAEPIGVPEASAPGPGSEGGSGSKAGPPPRLGFDLEHGYPMPPEARDPKPVY